MTVPEGATKFALHEPYVPASGTKIALPTPPHCMCGIKLALLARNGPFWRVSCVQGELCTAYKVDAEPVDTTAHRGSPVWRAPEGPEGQAAVPVGGGCAWPGFETPAAAGVEGAG